MVKGEEGGRREKTSIPGLVGCSAGGPVAEITSQDDFIAGACRVASSVRESCNSTGWLAGSSGAAGQDTCT